jgi:DNA-binding TFAR19-related protein (PDSD5 family)
MSASGNSSGERLRFIKHKGHTVYLIDFSHCTAREMLSLLELVRADIAGHAPNSLLTLADFTQAQVDKNVATRMKEVLVLDRPYVKRSAWVGTESVPHVFYEHFKNFSQRDFPVFNSREEAMEWLVQDDR